MPDVTAACQAALLQACGPDRVIKLGAERKDGPRYIPLAVAAAYLARVIAALDPTMQTHPELTMTNRLLLQQRDTRIRTALAAAQGRT